MPKWLAFGIHLWWLDLIRWLFLGYALWWMWIFRHQFQCNDALESCVIFQPSVLHDLCIIAEFVIAVYVPVLLSVSRPVIAILGVWGIGTIFRSLVFVLLNSFLVVLPLQLNYVDNARFILARGQLQQLCTSASLFWTSLNQSNCRAIILSTLTNLRSLLPGWVWGLLWA